MTSCYVFDAAKSRGHRFTVSNLVEMVEALSTRPIYQGSSLIASGRHAFHGGNQNIIQGLKSDAVTLSYALEEALRWYDGYVRMQETAIARAKSMASSKNGRKSPNSLV